MLLDTGSDYDRVIKFKDELTLTLKHVSINN